MRRLLAWCFLSLFFVDPSCLAQDKETLLSEVDQLKIFIEQGNMDRAGNLLERIRGDLHAFQLAEARPELQGNTYKNTYFQLQVSNPVQEWQMQMLSPPEKTLPGQENLHHLVRILNPTGPEGIEEKILVSAYDVKRDPAFLQGYTDGNQIVEKLGTSFLQKQEDGFLQLVEKEDVPFQEERALRIVMEGDMGFGKRMRSIHWFLYVPSGAYVLLVSCVMASENFSVYQYLFEEILSTIRLGDSFKESVNVVPASFTDIYLRRLGKAE